MTLSVLRGFPETIYHTFYNGTVPIDADGDVIVTATKADGSTVAEAAATNFDSGAHTYSFVLPAQSTLNVLTAVFSGEIGGEPVLSPSYQVEIVGGFYVPLVALHDMPGLASIPAATLAAARREFEDLAEEYCGTAFVPRFARETVSGAGRTSILLGHTHPRTILSATSTDTAGVTTPFTTSNWRLLDYGALVTDGDALTATVYGERNLTVEYEHGLDAPPPGIVKACKLWVRNQVLQDRNSGARDVLREVNGEGYSVQYSTPDWDAGRPTGMFDVDRALNAVGRRAPSIA